MSIPLGTVREDGYVLLELGGVLGHAANGDLEYEKGNAERVGRAFGFANRIEWVEEPRAVVATAPLNQMYSLVGWYGVGWMSPEARRANG